MSKSKMIAAVLAASLTLSAPNANAAAIPVPAAAAGATGAAAAVYGVMGCAALIMLAASIKAQLFKKELTPAEAASCGLTFLFRP